VYHSHECPVEGLSLSIDLPRSIAKSVIRFRMAALAWMVGWISVLLYQALGSFDNRGAFFSLDEILEDTAGRPFLICSGSVLLATMVQALSGTQSVTSLLGTTEITLLPFTILMCAWSFSVVSFIWRCLSTSIAWTRVVLGRFALLRSSNQSSSTVTRRASIVSAVTLLGFVQLFLPHQMAFVVLFTILYITLVFEDAGSPRESLLSCLILLMVVLLPFNVTVLAVWGRNLWVNWRHPFPRNYDVLHILPLVVLVELWVSGHVPKPRKGLLAVIRTALLVCAGSAFLIGPRRTFVLPYMANVVFVLLCGLMWG